MVSLSMIVIFPSGSLVATGYSPQMNMEPAKKKRRMCRGIFCWGTKSPFSNCGCSNRTLKGSNCAVLTFGSDHGYKDLHWPYYLPLKLQALGKLICYRHIAHVTQKVTKSFVFLRGKTINPMKPSSRTIKPNFAVGLGQKPLVSIENSDRWIRPVMPISRGSACRNGRKRTSAWS